MMGVAMGCIRLSMDDFCRLTIDEFEAIHNAWRQNNDAEYMDAWERMRLLATITIQPHIKNRMSAQKLLPFSWDNKSQLHAETSLPQSKEESQRRFERLAKR